MNTTEDALQDAEMPKDAKIIALILKSLGVKEYEPRVLHQFLEFMHRYILDVFQDAQFYSEHAGKDKIELEDVRLAIQSRVNHSFTQPPPREVLMELAQKKNAINLPAIPPKLGVLLPREQYCLTAPNYQICPSNKEEVGKKRERSSVLKD